MTNAPVQTLDEMKLAAANWSLRIKCKQSELKEFMGELLAVIPPNAIIILEQRIHDLAYLSSKEGLVVGAMNERARVEAEAEAAKKAAEAANEPVAEATAQE